MRATIAIRNISPIPFARAQINCLVRGILAHGYEARELQPFLHRGDVIVAHRPRQVARFILRAGQSLHQ
jgi:hypothetical protein